MGTSQDAISDWERGKSYPSHNNGKKLKDFFNAPSLEWLMSEDSTKP
jgi:transcriptional regulator with XRE-family HTH domain